MGCNTHRAQYYKPWDLLPRQEQKIKQQIADIEETISKEIPNINPNRGTEVPDAANPEENGKSGEEETNTVGTNSQDQTDTATSAKADVDTNANEAATATATTEAASDVAAAEHEVGEDRMDENENDEVVEGGEDAVIY